MPKDYKNINKAVKKPRPLLGNLLSFITGLTVGLFVAFLVYLNEHRPQPATPRPERQAVPVAEAPRETAEPQVAEEEAGAPPPPTFDFYTILPNREVSVSDWAAESKAAETTSAERGSQYLFQVGSFKEFSAADQMRARLALLGIDAEIQRVVINGQDEHHRVRVGPYRDHEKISQIRERLMADNIEFMLIKQEMEE